MANHYNLPKGNSFVVIKKIDNDLMLYDPYFGNPIKFPNGQTGASINMFRSNIAEMFKSNPKLNLKFVKSNSNKGFSISSPAFVIRGLTNKKTNLSVNGNHTASPKYDWLNPMENIFYCIKTPNNKYYLYDWDMEIL